MQSALMSIFASKLKHMTQNPFLFLNLGGGEIFVVVLVIIIFFGAKSLPELAKGLGKGIREFKDAMNGVQREFQNEMHKIEDSGKEEKNDQH
jgi:sec-independent protein translocase protein TatA